MTAGRCLRYAWQDNPGPKDSVPNCVSLWEYLRLHVTLWTDPHRVTRSVPILWYDCGAICNRTGKSQVTGSGNLTAVDGLVLDLAVVVGHAVCLSIVDDDDSL